MRYENVRKKSRDTLHGRGMESETYRLGLDERANGIDCQRERESGGASDPETRGEIF